jgi:APA family basic amino acid/polyamine antiporter
VANQAADAPTRLARRLGTTDAVMLGLGSMVGAGVFVAIAPAARTAGNALLLGLVLAAAVAYCNAMSSAQLAALYPESGGAYVYGRKRLGAFWGYLAGSAFLIGKLASCAAMAITFGSYAAPTFARPVAVAAALALTAVAYRGVQKTALVTRLLVIGVLTCLCIAVAGMWLGGATDAQRVWPLKPVDAWSILQSAGFLFFAFAGYARMATLGEEVSDPARVIPRAIPLALAMTLVIYAVIAVSVVVAIDTDALAASPAPLAAAVEAGRLGWLSPVVRVGAAVASLSVLLSLLGGISRTTFAMARSRDLPSFLGEVHPRFRVPHRAEVAAGCLVAVVAALGDVRSVIGFSSFAVLFYYAIANASAWTLSRSERRWPRIISLLGLLGCLAIALTLPPASIITGAALLAVAAGIFAARRRAR